MQLNHLELFAGIGGFRKAIDLFCKDNNIESSCVGFSEKDKFAIKTYKANYSTESEVEMGDIQEFTSNDQNISKLPQFDLLTGGFPCQSFSMMGKQKGLEDRRGELFYSIVEILKIKQPKYVILENVRNLKTHDNGNTFKEIKRSLNDDAGYDVITTILNTADFGLPQNRRRIFLICARKDLNLDMHINIDTKAIQKSFSSVVQNSSLNTYKNVLDGILEKEVDQKYYLSEKFKPTILSNGTKNFKSKSEINQMIARPLTATMVKMHRACQDNYYSDGFLNATNPLEYLKKKYSKEELAKQPIRKLTPLEALKLQGFDENFYNNTKEAKLSNTQIYKQSGNAVSVNTIYALLHHLHTNNILNL